MEVRRHNTPGYKVIILDLEFVTPLLYHRLWVLPPPVTTTFPATLGVMYIQNTWLPSNIIPPQASLPFLAAPLGTTAG